VRRRESRQARNVACDASETDSWRHQLRHGGLAISPPSSPVELADGIGYFFGALPDEAVRAQFMALGERFRRSHHLFGLPVSAECLHLALCPVGRAEQLAGPLESALLAAGEAVAAQEFSASFDLVLRLSARDGQFPLVACGDQMTTDAALTVRKAIAEAQAAHGLRVGAVSSFLPHVELMQGPAMDAIQEPVPPISWRVSEFVLVRTFFGQSRHAIVGRWRLAPKRVQAPIDLLEEIRNLPDFPLLPDED